MPTVPCLALMGSGPSLPAASGAENDNVYPRGLLKPLQKKYVFLSVSCRCLKGGMQGNFVGCLTKLSFTGPHLDNFLTHRENSQCCVQSPELHQPLPQMSAGREVGAGGRFTHTTARRWQQRQLSCACVRNSSCSACHTVMLPLPCV